MGEELLNLEVYSLAMAANLLGVPQSTLQYWLDGKRGYDPVIRIKRTGSKVLTWGEFIEAAYLRGYRRELRVELDQIRQFIRILRERQSTQFPLAYYRPGITDGSRLLVEAQEEAGLQHDLWLVFSPVDGQMVFTEYYADFVRRVDWVNDVASAWRPHDDINSPVRCNPLLRFGKPSIKGISTLAIVEHLDGGENSEDVADQFNLEIEQVEWAKAYELSHQTVLTSAA